MVMYKRKTNLFSAAIIAMIMIFSIPPAPAQPPELAGKNELSLYGGFDFQGPNGDNIHLQVGYGWFLRDDLLIGGEYQWTLIEDIAPGDYRSQQASLVAKKLFIGDSELVPYVGVEIGFRNTKYNDNTELNDLDDSGLLIGGRIGVQYFLTESVSIDGSLIWLLADDEIFIVDFETDDQYLYPSFGINAVF